MKSINNSFQKIVYFNIWIELGNRCIFHSQHFNICKFKTSFLLLNKRKNGMSSLADCKAVRLFAIKFIFRLLKPCVAALKPKLDYTTLSINITIQIWKFLIVKLELTYYINILIICIRLHMILIHFTEFFQKIVNS